MINFQQIAETLATNNNELKQMQDELFGKQQELARINELLQRIDDGSDISLPIGNVNDLLSAKADIESDIADLNSGIASTRSAIDTARNNFTETDPTLLIRNMDDAIPFLLLPMRVETKYMKVRNKNELDNPVVVIDPGVIRVVDGVGVVIDVLDDFDPGGSGNTGVIIDVITTQTGVVGNILSGLPNVNIFEKQRLDDALATLQNTAAPIVDGLNQQAQTIQTGIASIDANTTQITGKNTLLTNSINRIKLLSNPLLNLPLGGVTNNLVIALNSLTTTLNTVINTTYTTAAQVVQAQILVKTGLDNVNAKINLVTGLLSVLQLNTILTAHTNTKTALTAFNNIVAGFRGTQLEIVTNLVNTSTTITNGINSITNAVGDVDIQLFPQALTSYTVTDELWVRFYPDDISVDDHETELTAQEIKDAQFYWTESWIADKTEREKAQLGLWRRLLQTYGAARAAYIVKAMTPSNYNIQLPIPEIFELEAEITRYINDINALVDRSEVEVLVYQHLGGGLVTGVAQLNTALTGTLALLPEEAEALRNLSRGITDATTTFAAEAQKNLVVGLYTGLLADFIGDITYENNFLENFINSVPTVSTGADNTVYVGEDPLFPNVRTVPLFPANVPTKNDSWAKAPVVRVLPDRFMVRLYKNDMLSYEVIGAPIPNVLPVGLNPSDETVEVENKTNGDLDFGEDLNWMFQFNEALKVGMAVRIEITSTEATHNPTLPGSSGFDKLTVLGVRTSTKQASQNLIEELFESHHYTGNGLRIVPQGTATNNTDKKSAGFVQLEQDTDLSFKAERSGFQYVPTNNPLSKSDGQRLVESLGLRDDLFQQVSNSAELDIRDAIAMNTALWQGTMGTFLEDMLNNIIRLDDIKSVRTFFINNVTGRGTLPAFAVGDQPYGIITASAYSKLNFTREDIEIDDFKNALKQIIVDDLGGQWKSMSNHVKTILSATSIDPNASNKLTLAQGLLMEILGLHPSSMEFKLRLSAGQGYQGAFKELIDEVAQEEADWDYEKWDALKEDFDALFTDYPPNDGFQIDKSNLFTTLFLDTSKKLGKKLIDNNPLSETRTVNNANFSNGINYIQYLFDTRLDIIRQKTISGQEPSQSLLYSMLRYSQFLQYWDAAMEILEIEGLLTPENQIGSGGRKNYRNYRMTSEGTGPLPPKSKWFFLFSKYIGLRGAYNESIAMADFLESPLNSKYYEVARPLFEYKRALSVLVNLSTSKLERAMVEHLDLMTYRLDAWQLGLVNEQLAISRSQIGKEKGSFLGAYGYLEDIRPAAKRLDASGHELQYDFDANTELSATKDPENQGYIHAPSIAHAITAAVLRTGYISNASPETDEFKERFAIDISSERTRNALVLIEGIRNGQPLGALLGYQFERAIRERSIDLLAFVYELRKIFPLNANKIDETVDSNLPIEVISAENSLDGLLLVEAFKSEAAPFLNNTFAIPTVTITSAQALAMFNEAKKLSDVLDALSDLVLAEGVFQLSKGNMTRANAMLQSLSDSDKPMLVPEITQTPKTGISITNRVCVNFAAISKMVTENVDTNSAIQMGVYGEGENINPWSGSNIALTPRALTELSLNRWIGQVIGLDPTAFRCMISYETASGITTSAEIQLADLQIQPIDVLFLLGSIGDFTNQDSELANLIRFRARQKFSSIPNQSSVTVNLLVRGVNWSLNILSLYELSTIIQPLYKLVTSSKYLRPNDLVTSSSDSNAETATGAIDVIELRRRLYQNSDNTIEITFPFSRFFQVNTLVLSAEFLQTAYSESNGIFQIFTNIVLRLREATLAVFSNPNTLTIEELKNVLMEAYNLGVSQAIPVYPTYTTVEERKLLLDQGNSVLKILDDRLSTLSDAVQSGNLAEFEENEQGAQLLADTIKSLFNQSMVVLPLFTAHNAAGINAGYNKSATILPGNDAYAVDKWVMGLTKVRNKIKAYDSVSTCYEMFKNNFNVVQNPLKLKPIQLSQTNLDFWVAYDYSDTAKQFNEEVINIMMTLPNPNGQTTTFNAGSNSIFTGLMLDEWVETIPFKDQQTGVAVHFNQPNACPPQTVLLAVSPTIDGSWDWENLNDTILETMSLAKMRGVEPDHFTRNTTTYKNLFAQLFPTVLAEVTKNADTIAVELYNL